MRTLNPYLLFLVAAFLLLGSCSTKKEIITARNPLLNIEPIEAKRSDSFSISFRPSALSLPVRKRVVTTNDYYEEAYQELESMLSGTKALDFERAVFISENPYYNNTLSYKDFQKNLDVHEYFVRVLAKANDKSDSMDFNAYVNEHGRFRLDDIRFLPEEKKELYQKTLRLCDTL